MNWDNFRQHIDGKPMDMVIVAMIMFGYCICVLWASAPKWLNNIAFAVFFIGVLLMVANLVRPINIWFG